MDEESLKKSVQLQHSPIPLLEQLGMPYTVEGDWIFTPISSLLTNYSTIANMDRAVSRIWARWKGCMPPCGMIACFSGARMKIDREQMRANPPLDSATTFTVTWPMSTTIWISNIDTNTNG